MSMASLLERFGALFRSRVGKFDAQALPYEMGLQMASPVGHLVSDSTALGLSSVYACVYRIATSISTLDYDIMVREGQGSTQATNHPAFNLIKYTPNEYQTASEFWETLVSYAVANGAGHAVIKRDNAGYAEAMYCLPPDEVEIIATKNGPMVKAEGYGLLPVEDVFCLYNLQRKSPIKLHRENLGLAAAAQRYGAEWYSEGQMSGILTTDQPLRNEQMNAIRRSWREQGKAGTRVVPHGLRYHRITIAPDEAQFIETRKFQAEEVARIFGVPPSLIQLDSQATYNNVEQQHIQYGRMTIAPWARKIEREIDAKLLHSYERPAHYARLDLRGLYRGDMQARKDYYEAMIRMGVMSINEVRAKEDMNPVEGGDEHFVPVNHVSLKQFPSYSEKLANDSQPTQSNEGV